MPSYVVLGNWTAEGVRSVRESPARGEAFRKLVEGAGGRVVHLLYTMGPHDFVTFLEFPSDEAANAALLRAASQGYARTITLKGWTAQEFREALAKL
jgi:uncharacterized protein with GYD domain